MKRQLSRDKQRTEEITVRRLLYLRVWGYERIVLYSEGVYLKKKVSSV